MAKEYRRLRLRESAATQITMVLAVGGGIDPPAVMGEFPSPTGLWALSIFLEDSTCAGD